jgi:hypothetical protein
MIHFLEVNLLDRIAQFNEEVVDFIFKNKKIALIFFYSGKEQHQDALNEFISIEN